MSGGSMDYVYMHVHEAADQVMRLMERMEDKDVSEFEYDASRMVGMTAQRLKDKVVALLKMGVMALRKGAIYAKRAEWLESDDDGYDSFVTRTLEELGQYEDKGESDLYLRADESGVENVVTDCCGKFASCGQEEQ